DHRHNVRVNHHSEHIGIGFASQCLIQWGIEAVCPRRVAQFRTEVSKNNDLILDGFRREIFIEYIVDIKYVEDIPISWVVLFKSIEDVTAEVYDLGEVVAAQKARRRC